MIFHPNNIEKPFLRVANKLPVKTPNRHFYPIFTRNENEGEMTVWRFDRKFVCDAQYFLCAAFSK